MTTADSDSGTPGHPLPPPPPEDDLAEGQIRCPQCGEALFATETSCWRCGHQLRGAPPPPAPSSMAPDAAQPPAAQPLPPQPALPGAPVGRAVTALVLAVIGLIFPCIGPVFSILALREAARVAETENAGLRVAAQVIAIIGLIAFALIAGLAALGWLAQINLKS